MSKRTPLAQREVVEPVDMYTKPQVGKTISGQVGEPTNGQTDKKAKPLVEKYTTHLRPEIIKAIKRAALESDRKDYEVVQAALEQYLNQ